jgi:multidrug efflux pump subunit AcrB
MLSFQHKQDLIGLFAQHKVAATLTMLMMILAGAWALSRLNTQFLPNFAVDIITVRVVWSGASAEDVESSITQPIEQELRGLDNLKKMTSTSATGVSAVSLEYHEGSDMVTAMDRVKERVALLRNLPSSAEKAEISKAEHYEVIARLLLTGTKEAGELRHLARRMESELLGRGISKVSVNGLPEEEMAIQIPTAALQSLGLSHAQVADKIAATSRDLPAGSVGRDDVARQLRSLDQRRDALAFEAIPIAADKAGRLVKLSDVAEIERRPKQGEPLLFYQGQPAVELMLYRTEHNDALKAANIMQAWVDATRPHLPPEIKLQVFDESWTLIWDRILLLVNNGLGGMLVVIAILFLFLNIRVAWWVAMGVPISLLAAMVPLYFLGGSINMISLFAMIMMLGILVDDAIVVGEDAYTHYQTGEKSLQAAEGGARRVVGPVLAASLTTIAAFAPLMAVGGIIGNILFSIPLVVICALIASMFECFLILPGHLRQSFIKMRHAEPPPLRRKLEAAFNFLRDRLFRPLVTLAVGFRWITLAAGVSLLLLGIGLLAGGRLHFTFFPTPDSNIINANFSFAAGTPPERMRDFLLHLDGALREADKELGGGLVVTTVMQQNISYIGGGQIAQRGDQFGMIFVELTQPDARSIRNREILQAWEKRIVSPPGLENLSIAERRGGPPGRDVDIRLSGGTPDTLKAAAMELREVLKTIPGVIGAEDDMPYGREQLIYRLRPEAIALGLTVDSVGRQLRAGFDGQLAQIFLDGKDEVEVRVMLPDAERYRMAGLEQFSLQLPAGGAIPLRQAVELQSRRGFDALRHYQGDLSVQVSADVDKELNNANQVLARLEEEFLPRLSARHGIRYSFEGRAADQQETMRDMKIGLVVALLYIYLILAWVFGSYGWPLIIMTAIPFGLVGAITGHWLMGMDMTILSLFGFFGLAGIAVNDSIVLIEFYRQLRDDGLPVREALIEAACQRLRAVLLTSLSTIGGLTPLLLEKSLQAQFLIPMAVSISFGLMFTTVLVLLFTPSLLSIYESGAAMLQKLGGSQPVLAQKAAEEE